MRTLHVDTGRIWRGGQRQCLLLCRHLAGLGHETHVVTQPGSALGRRAAAARVDPDAPDCPSASRPVCHSMRMGGELDLLAAVRLGRLLGRVKPDLVAAHDAHALTLLALARRCAGVRCPIVFHRRVDVSLGKGPGSRWKIRQADLIICVSRCIAEVVREGGVESARVRVVHSGTIGVVPNEAGGRALRHSLGISRSAVVMGTVSGLIMHKGHVDLLAALDRLEPAERSIFLLVAGDGPLRARLEKDVASRGLGSVVRFLGEVTDLGSLFAALDIFVHPSRTEGLGTSIIDAFSAGLAVVASSAGGIPELVREGETGFLCEPGNPRSLAETLKLALGDESERSARAARGQTEFREHLTAGAMAESTIQCYGELLGR